MNASIKSSVLAPIFAAITFAAVAVVPTPAFAQEDSASAWPSTPRPIQRDQVDDEKPKQADRERVAHFGGRGLVAGRANPGDINLAATAFYRHVMRSDEHGARSYFEAGGGVGMTAAYVAPQSYF